jgi:hypothetical protein
MVNDNRRRVNGDRDREFEAVNASFSEAYRREIALWVGPRYEAIRARPMPNPDGPSVSNDLYGLALSGGGMRSATYSLGVLQGLARAGMLRDLDYISTVSGGGYLGSSLSALWSPSQDPPPLSRPLGVEADNFPFQYPGPVPESATGSVVHGLETPALRHVRENAKMLGSSIGLLDLETWTALTRYLTKTVLLWAFVPVAMVTLVFLATMFIPESLWDRFSPFDARLGRDAIPVWAALMPAWFLAAFGALSMLPGQDQIRNRRPLFRAVRSARELLLVLAWLTAGALLLVLGIWGFHVALIQDDGWKSNGLEVLLGGTAAVSGGLAAIAARVFAVSGGLKQKVAAYALNYSGYILLGFAMIAWYHLLWTTVFPSSENIGMLGESGWGAWQFVAYGFIGSGAAVLLSLTAVGPWFLNWTSLSNLYMRRIGRTWIIGAGRDEGFAPADGWTSVATRTGLRVADLDGSRHNAPYQLITAAVNRAAPAPGCSTVRRTDSSYRSTRSAQR